MSEPILQVRNISKVIGSRTIVDDLSFEVRPREVFGFLGPNGAGKTTTIRMLVGLIRPTSGTITVGGYDIAKDFESAIRTIGCIVETPDLYRFMSGRENLEHFARMLGPIDPSEIERLAALVHLDHRLEDKVRTYSLGMRQRLGIAIALLGSPRLLILDEPANGLDPAGMREMRELIRRLVREQEVAIFISSHLLAEVEQVCDRVAIIHRGELKRIGPVQDLLVHQQAVDLRVDDHARATAVAMELGLEPSMLGSTMTVTADNDQSSRLIEALVRNDVNVYSAAPRLPTLEELFLEATAGETVD